MRTARCGASCTSIWVLSGPPSAARSPSPGGGRRLLATAARGSGDRVPAAQGRTGGATAAQDDVFQGLGRPAAEVSPGPRSLRNELTYWKSVTEPQRVAKPVEHSSRSDAPAKNTEGSCQTLKVALSAGETQALLQQVPAAYNTQINDVLLTALARAWNQSSGSPVLFTNLEGHGRENLFDDVDLSRTVGWFTSIFPVRLELPASGNRWEPAAALKSIKEQLRGIPQHGIGYGILRYLGAGPDLSTDPQPSIVFNYLGQFDQLLTDSTLFRFASESTGPWHSSRQRRRHALEVNCLVIGGRLELWWTYSRDLHDGIRR